MIIDLYPVRKSFINGYESMMFSSRMKGIKLDNYFKAVVLIFTGTMIAGDECNASVIGTGKDIIRISQYFKESFLYPLIFSTIECLKQTDCKTVPQIVKYLKIKAVEINK